tara:strand:+ start:283 stop:1608 length:1326 start_codon:yes stop_codon:yes gene_type:complete
MAVDLKDAEKVNPLKIGLDALGWVGEKQDQLDKAVGIGKYNVYNARHLLIDPVTSAASRLHPAAGVAANIGMEMLVPDSTLYAGKLLKGIRGISKAIKGTRPSLAIAGDAGRLSNVKPLMIKRSSTSINDKLVEQGSKNLNKGKSQLNIPKVAPPPNRKIQILQDAHAESTDLIEIGTKTGKGTKFNQGADGIYNITNSQKHALKEKLVEEVKSNNWSKTGIKHHAMVDGEKRFLRWNGPKGGDKNNLKHWSLSKVSAQAKSAAERAIGELGPLSHQGFKPWAKKLGYTDKQIDDYAKYVETSVKASEKEMSEVNKILRKQGVPREELTTLAHNTAIAKGGIHGTRNIDFEPLSKNVSEGKHSAKPTSSQIATGVPHYSDKLKNWKTDFLYHMDQKKFGGSGVLPQKHQMSRQVELMIERAAKKGGVDAVNDLLQKLKINQ